MLPHATIRVRVDGAVGTILLDRDNRRNALTRAMIADLRQALGDLHLEQRVRSVILTGVGSAFCAGRDVQELAASDETDAQRFGEEAEQFRDLLAGMLEFPKPLIAAVNGPALASGAALVLACDVTIASPTATFGLPEPRWGLVAGPGAALLAFRIGAGPAGKLLLVGETIPVAEAHRLGIYHEVTPVDSTWARAKALGDQIAACAPQAVQLAKRQLYETIGEQLSTQLTSGAIASATARTTDAAREGLAAFLEKRPPVW